MSDVVPAGAAKVSREDVLAKLVDRFDRALEALAGAKPFAKSVYQTDVFQAGEALLTHRGGLEHLYARAHRFDEVGVFQGGAWADPSKLRAPLVAGSLALNGIYPVVESFSELRMLAIATEKCRSDAVTAEQARTFLEEVMALNLNYVFPADTEAERVEGGPFWTSNVALFALIADEIGVASLRTEVLREIEQICAQRPIVTNNVRRMIAMVGRIPADQGGTGEEAQTLRRYSEAISGPSPLSKQHPGVADYRAALMGVDEKVLETEARAFAASLAETGLASKHHAVFLRHIRKRKPELLEVALGLNGMGIAELEQNNELARKLLKVAIVPSTAQVIYGFARMLERGLLSRQAVAGGFRRIVELDLDTDIKRNLLAQREKRDGVTANAILLAGTISVLGQPLGIGQGRNPTCQAARGISLWAQHAPGYLLEILITAARDGLVQMPFEGILLKSNELPSINEFLDLDLDPVSIVLVPHLDRLYAEMMRRVALRQEDSHKWVNPAFYGRWVASGFASAFLDLGQATVGGFEDFVRLFYASHHPAYNDGHPLMYPNPIGLCITNSHGDYLGLHALSLQRVAEDPDGELRAYFFNPNNEGRQDWGNGIRPSVYGHGEKPGESSLPFHEFACRLYAFHYNPYEEGDAYAVPDETVSRVLQEAKNSWGRAFRWAD